MGSGQSAPLLVEEELSPEEEHALILPLLTVELNVKERDLRLKIAILKIVQVKYKPIQVFKTIVRCCTHQQSTFTSRTFVFTHLICFIVTY